MGLDPHLASEHMGMRMMTKPTYLKGSMEILAALLIAVMALLIVHTSPASAQACAAGWDYEDVDSEGNYINDDPCAAISDLPTTDTPTTDSTTTDTSTTDTSTTDTSTTDTSTTDTSTTDTSTTELPATDTTTTTPTDTNTTDAPTDT